MARGGWFKCMSMRSDMHKVVTERPRWGSWMRSLKTGVSYSGYDPDKDYGPSRMSSSRFRLPVWKEFTDVLGPLRRFLQKQVGRPWDKVYSEIKRGIDGRKLTGRHVLDHVAWEVERDCFVGRDRGVYATRTGRPVGGFYVHPRTGLLRWAKPVRWARPKPAAPVDRVSVDPLREFVLHKGVWHLDTYRALDPDEVLGVREDRLTGRAVPVRRGDTPGAARRALVRRKQANRKELAELRALREGRRG